MDTGSVFDRERSGRPRTTTSNHEFLNVIDKILENPENTIRKLAQQCNIRATHVHTIYLDGSVHQPYFRCDFMSRSTRGSFWTYKMIIYGWLQMFYLVSGLGCCSHYWKRSSLMELRIINNLPWRLTCTFIGLTSRCINSRRNQRSSEFTDQCHRSIEFAGYLDVLNFWIYWSTSTGSHLCSIMFRRIYSSVITLRGEDRSQFTTFLIFWKFSPSVQPWDVGTEDGCDSCEWTLAEFHRKFALFLDFIHFIHSTEQSCIDKSSKNAYVPFSSRVLPDNSEFRLQSDHSSILRPDPNN